MLLAHADRWGVVRELGIAKLTDLTGLNQERLRAHLFKLSEMGFISHKLPGFSSWPLMGKWGSVYFLNLHHPDLRQAYPASSIAVMDSRDECGRCRQTEAGLIVGRAVFQSGQGFAWSHSERGFLGQPSEDCVSDDLARYFLPPVRIDEAAVTVALQFVLNELASSLLSTHWCSLERVTVDDELRKSVRNLLKPSKRCELPMERIDLMLGQAAIALARRVQGMLKPFTELALEACDYRLLPAPALGMAGWDGGQRCVLIRPKNGEPIPAVFVCGESVEHSPTRYELEQYPWLSSPLLTVPKPLTRYGRKSPAGR